MPSVPWNWIVLLTVSNFPVAIKAADGDSGAYPSAAVTSPDCNVTAPVRPMTDWTGEALGGIGPGCATAPPAASATARDGMIQRIVINSTRQR